MTQIHKYSFKMNLYIYIEIQQNNVFGEIQEVSFLLQQENKS